MEKPNILFVFGDQHRWSDLGCYGNKQVKTPNFDKFAKMAIRVNGCISNSPVCVPARGSILTGLFPQKHGALTNDLAIDYDVTSIADVLNDTGYHTGYIGKWHLCGIPREQFIDKERRLGFKEWKVANCNHNYLKCYYDDEDNNRHLVDGYEPEMWGELAIDFINRNNSDKPWALYLSFATPHGPHNIIKQEYLDIYKDIEIELPPNVEDSIMINKQKTMSKQKQIIEAKGYYGHITAIDKQFGILLDLLKDTNQLDNTIIVYTADHGEMLGSHGLTDKQLPYEESIRVPLIVYWKGHTIAGQTNELIGLTDLPVSILGMINEKFPDDIDGKDLHNIFTDTQAKGLDECYIFDLYPCHNAFKRGSSEWRGIRSKQYTYAKTAANEWLLFDNAKDPYQMNNLINNHEYKRIKEDLYNKLDEFINANDKMLTGDDYIRYSGRVDEFNQSQIYFGFDPIEP